MCTGYTEFLWRYLREIYTWGNIDISVWTNIISEDGKRKSYHIFPTTESKTLIIHYLYYLSLIYLSYVQDWDKISKLSFSSVQSLSCVRLFVTPWIAARQASLSITNSWNSLRLTSIKLVNNLWKNKNVIYST